MYLRKKQKKKIQHVEKDQIKKLFKEIFPTINLKLFPDHSVDIENITEKDYELLINHLFFLCIISNRLEIAKVFWKLGKVF